VESNPAGAEVIVDGHARGRTPFQADLTPGHHQLEVKLGDARRTIPVVLQAGLAASHYVEFARAEAPPAAPESAPAAPVAIAALEVRSEPSGARVSVDGSHRGSTPLVVKELAPGEHTVRVSGPFRTVSRKVDLAAGQHGLLIVTPTEGSEPARAAASRSSNEGDGARSKASSPGRGWVTVDSPLVLRVLRNGSFIGTSEDGRLPLEAGEHTLSLENDSVNFRESRMVLVEAGKGQPLRVELPQGMLSINAVPWAEVYIDNKRIGETPVAQLALPVGVHEIRFQHPDYGERRMSALVRVGVPGRTFVDFTK
jgi:hypothetical protein